MVNEEESEIVLQSINIENLDVAVQQTLQKCDIQSRNNDYVVDELATEYDKYVLLYI